MIGHSDREFGLLANLNYVIFVPFVNMISFDHHAYYTYM